MKHSTNYYDTFIEVSEDCPAVEGEMPPQKGDKKSIANLLFEKLYETPYQFTSDEVLFDVFAIRKEFTEAEMDEQQEHFFSKGQPCFRTSPLTKRYGWGVHSNQEGKIAIYSYNSSDYNNLIDNSSIKKIKAMRNKKAT